MREKDKVSKNEGEGEHDAVNQEVGATDEEHAEELFQEHIKRAEEEVEAIKSSSNNKVGRVWE